MYRNLWKKNHGAICSITLFNQYGFSILKVSGFKVDKYLVSDQSVFYAKNAEEVELKFVKEDGVTPLVSKRIPFEQFVERTIIGKKKETKGYALVNINYPEFTSLPSLKLSENQDSGIGKAVAVLGFQAEKGSLAINTGIVSSTYVKENNSYLQIDSNIQFGNSGSPVIDPETNEVVGIIGHRLSEINQVYENLMDIINTNLDQLKDAEGRMSIGDVDPVQAMIASQNQIKHLAKEMYKSSIQRVGYAYQIDYLVSYFKENVELQHKKSSLQVRLEE